MRPFTRMLLAVLAVAVVVPTLVAGGQAPAAPISDPISSSSRTMFKIVSGFVSRSADKVGEDLYSFKPTPEVRSFGQLVGHVADANFGICATAQGEKPPMQGIEKSKSSKADLVKALADSFAYCQKAYDSMSDARGAEVVPFFGQKMARVSVLDFNTAHNYEHYGNMVTYMRLKGIVPPSSEPQKK